MPNGTSTISPPVVLGQSEHGLTISFPGGGGGPSVVGTVTIPFSTGGTLPMELNFSEGLVVALPGDAVGSVTFPAQPGAPPVELPIPDQGLGLIDMPQGGHLVVTIPEGPTRRKIRVVAKAGVGARLFTEAASM